MKTAIEIILEERKRQIEVEGWTPEHDIEEHTDGALSLAAACYAAYPLKLYRKEIYERSIQFDQLIPFDEYQINKKHSEIKRLAIAGALILAEIERLQATFEEGKKDEQTI